MKIFALRYDMESHIISKGEKKQMFLEMEDNKSCIFNPMGGKRLPWGSYYGLIVKIHSKMVLKIRFHIMYVESGTPDIK
jgi:hypothetical protein